MRKFFRLASSSLLLACLIARPASGQATQPVAANDGPLVLGISSSAEGNNDIPKRWPRPNDIGVMGVRSFPEWNNIQPKKGEWKWENADARLKLADELGFSVYGGLHFVTPWASSGNDTRTFPLKDANDWGTYAAGVM